MLMLHAVVLNPDHCFFAALIAFESRLMLSMHRNRLYSHSFTSAAPHTADLVTGMYFAVLFAKLDAETA
jgi:hypothetical protein